MTVTATATSLSDLNVDALVIPLTTDAAAAPSASITALGASVKHAASDLDEAGDTAVCYADTSNSPRLVLACCGDAEAIDLDTLRTSVAAAATSLHEVDATTAALALPALPVDDDRAAQALVEGLLLAHYRYDAYKTEDTATPLDTLHVVYTQKHDAEAVEAGTERAHHLVAATCTARDLVNQSPHEKTARDLAVAAETLGEAHGFDVETWDKSRIEEEGMGGLLAVNRGSVEPPTFSILSWTPEEAVNSQPVMLVGKGIVFDTGGLSLKPTKNSMDFMKADMGGAAAVIGAFEAIARLNVPLHVVGLIPASDNRPGGHAYVPGEVVTMHSGATVEVMNTDAEGRMLLADALSYARRYDPELVIDLATLTGAAVTALGHHASALMTPENDTAVDRLYAMQRAGERTGDRVHPLPLYDPYKKQLKSEVADLQNVGGRPAGSITAGKFLEHFVDYPWMHLDIAGTAFLSSEQPYRPKGGTGVGVRLLADYLHHYATARSA